MVRAKSTLFQMQRKGMLGHASKLVEATFGEVPERLNPIDMGCTLHKFIGAVMHPVVVVKTHTHQAGVAPPSVLTIATGSTLPQIMICKVFFRQPGTIPVHTRPQRVNSPKTMVLLPVPRPCLPRTRRGPKHDSSSSRAPPNPTGTRQRWCRRRRRRKYTSLTARTLKPVSRAASKTVKSKVTRRNQ